MNTPLNLLDDFSRDGYIAVKPLFNSAKVEEINQELERFIAQVVPNMPPENVYYESVNDKSTLKQIQHVFEYDDYFFQLMTTGVVREIAEQLLQDTAKPINMQYFNKPAGVGQATPPHQDGYYFHLKPCSAVTGWLALEPVDEENGCVHYVTGSHKASSFRPHGLTGVIGFSQGITDFGSEDDRSHTKAFPGTAGTFLMHDARTIHFAGPNTSATRSRRALGFIYYANRAKEDVDAKQRYQQALDRSLRQSGKI